MNQRKTLAHALPKGLTLLELMVGLAVVSILFGIAIPSFQRLLDSYRVEVAVHALQHSLALARMEAVRAHRFMTVGAKPSGWSEGWALFLDLNGNAALDGPEVPLHELTPPVGLSITGNGSMRTYVGFCAAGWPCQTNGAFQAGTIRICNQRGEGMALVMNASGRVRQERLAQCAPP